MMSNIQSLEDGRLATDLVKNFGIGLAHLENPSNAIFASLFLPLAKEPCNVMATGHWQNASNPLDSQSNTGIPSRFCDMLLAAVRNPLFDPKKITFTDCMDMFRWIGYRRSESWTVVESRSRIDHAPKTFPRVVLECVTEFIRSEVENAMVCGRGNNWDLRYPLPHKRRHFSSQLMEWSNTLRNMMLVNSSWHGAARRLMGYSISAEAPTLDLTHNPHFGGWTRELHLSCPRAGNTDYPGPIDLETRFPTPVLRSLCLRIPGARLASLNFEVQKLPDEFMTRLCDAITTLTALKEFAFKLYPGNVEVVQRFSATLSQTRHQSLCILRLYMNVLYKDSSLQIEGSSDLLQTLAPLPKLHSIQLSYPTWDSERAMYIGGALWRRNLSDLGSPFTLNKLRVNCPAGTTGAAGRPLTWNAKPKDTLRSIICVDFRGNPQDDILLSETSGEATPSPIAGIVACALDLCSSAREVVFDGFQWTRMKLFDQLRIGMSMPHMNVEQLVIVIKSLPYPPRSDSWNHSTLSEKDLAKAQFSLNDIQLSEALALGLFPGLQVLKVVFPSDRLEIFVEGFEYAPGFGGERLGKWRDILLPHTRGKCVERGVEFYVDLEHEHM